MEPERRIDLDEARIEIDGEWLSEEDIKYAIKKKIEEEDFDVEYLSRALKVLKKAIDESVIMEFRAPKDMERAVVSAAEEEGISVGEYIRRAIESYSGGIPSSGGEEEEPEEEAAEEEPEVPEEEEPVEEEEEEPEEEPFAEEEPEVEEEEEEEPDLEIEQITRRRRRRKR
ncbi:MAG: hypothetical protein J7L61_00030 [Thermoplasmata archaeon]|nr:hypothetical protein [Thermoplasmata archaeon]